MVNNTVFGKEVGLAEVCLQVLLLFVLVQLAKHHRIQ